MGAQDSFNFDVIDAFSFVLLFALLAAFVI